MNPYTVIVDRCWIGAIKEKALDISKGAENQDAFVARFGARVAFGDLFNCYVPWDSEILRHRIWLKGGGFIEKTVDVKYGDSEDGLLTADLNTPERGVCEIYALMTGSMPTFTFRGWVPGQMLIRNENIRDFPWGKEYALEQKHLSFDFFYNDLDFKRAGVKGGVKGDLTILVGRP